MSALPAPQFDPTTSPLRATRGGAGTATAKMDLYTLQTKFWQLDDEQRFSANETRLYFYWLNRFNAAFWASQLARKCKQVEADLGFDDKTHSKARTGLEARGLLFYLAGDKTRAALWSLVGEIPTNARIRRKNSDESGLITPQMGRSISDESGPITPQMGRKNSDPYKEETKTSSGVETQTPPASVGVGAHEGENSSSLAASQKNTAPTPQPPAPAAEAAAARVEPCLVPGTPESRALATTMAAAWHITEGKNARRFAQFATFTRTLAAAGRLAEVAEQFAAYQRYRQLRGIQPYAIDTYLGHELQCYTDGAWCDCDWEAKATEAQQQAQQKTTTRPGEQPAATTATPIKAQTSW